MKQPTRDTPRINLSPYPPVEQKDLSRGMGVDMSSMAVTRRIDIVDELRELARDLAGAKRLGPVNSAPPDSGTFEDHQQARLGTEGSQPRLITD